jgi:inosose dehydratase
MGTVVQTAKETEILMDNTNEFVGLLFDVGHFAYAGEDYMSIFNKYHERIKHIHLKDIRKEIVQKVIDEDLSFLEGVRLGTFTVPGDGDIDFVPVVEAIKKYNYNGWLLVEAEQDPAKANPLEYAKKAMKYLKSIL